ncbi:MAG: universal stress protein [Labilithrix sp.]|nr:universal stress protein [Labilithrix sp.]MCW5812583.1 universal stress protein [Labilithrix sp.]
MNPFRHILVPVDFGDASEHAVDLALTLGTRFDAKVTLLHVSWMPPYYYSAYAEGVSFPIDEMETKGKAMLDQAFAKAVERYKRVETMMLPGDPWEKILEAVKSTGADLIVMGTHGRRGVVRVVLGSVAEKVVRHSPVPVLTVGPRR